MDEEQISEKEYEAIAVMRDIAVILYSEISQNLGRDSEYLSALYEYTTGLMEMASKKLFN